MMTTRLPASSDGRNWRLAIHPSQSVQTPTKSNTSPTKKIAAKAILNLRNIVVNIKLFYILPGF